MSQLDFMSELNHRIRVDHEFTTFERSLRIADLSVENLDLECIRTLVQHYKTHCAAFDEYVMTNTKSFAQACNSEHSLETIEKTLNESCAH